MKILLIGPANLNRMPYLRYYTDILDVNNINYDIVTWDRNRIGTEDAKYTYRDKNSKSKRGFIEYFKYSLFVKNILKNGNYSKVVIFGLQLSFFLSKYVISSKTQCVIDIRDYNKIIKFSKTLRLLKYAEIVTISSKGFLKWIPDLKNILISNNIRDYKTLMENKISNSGTYSLPLKIGYIGSIRDYKINIGIIEKINEKNDGNILMYYHGKSDIAIQLEEFALEKNYQNVFFTGEYTFDQEKGLYESIDFVSVCLSNDLNSKTLMPNRFYNALKHNKPMIALRGSYLSAIIESYNLGIVLKDLNEVSNIFEIINRKFSWDNYQKGKKQIYEIIEKENYNFYTKFKAFLTETEDI